MGVDIFTGFVCCSYLIEELQYTVEEALAAFKESRPPGVKHQDFVAELVRKHCDPLGEVLSIPQDHVILKRTGVSCVNACLIDREQGMRALPHHLQQLMGKEGAVRIPLPLLSRTMPMSIMIRWA